MAKLWRAIAKTLSGDTAEPKAKQDPLVYPSDKVKEKPTAKTSGVWFRLERDGAGISAWASDSACPYDEGIHVSGVTMIGAKRYRGIALDMAKIPKGDYHSMTKAEFEGVLI